MNPDMMYQAFLDLPRDQERWPAHRVKVEAVDLMGKAVLILPKNLNHTRKSKGKAHQKQLLSLAKASRNLIDKIDALSRTALAHMEDRKDSPRHPILLRKDLVDLIDFLARHEEEAEFVNVSPGRYPDEASPIVCHLAMQSFLAITGRVPKIAVKDNRAYGCALEFLSSVFQALDMTSSPEAQLRAWKSKEEKGKK